MQVSWCSNQQVGRTTHIYPHRTTQPHFSENNTQTYRNPFTLHTNTLTLFSPKSATTLATHLSIASITSTVNTRLILPVTMEATMGDCSPAAANTCVVCEMILVVVWSARFWGFKKWERQRQRTNSWLRHKVSCGGMPAQPVGHSHTSKRSPSMLASSQPSCTPPPNTNLQQGAPKQAPLTPPHHTIHTTHSPLSPDC